MSEALRVLVADAISEAGIEELRNADGCSVDVKTGMTPDELKATIGEYDALIVRSATKVTADVLAVAGRLRAIGRAGTGVDNIDLGAATDRGVVVMNTPGGNSVAAAELTLSLLLALARNVAQANAELREGRWERKKYMGSEVAGKKIGIVGLGRIGREVARMAQGFRMEALGYDPFVSTERAADLGIRGMELDALIAEADYITLHIPRTDETRHLIGAERLARMKQGVRIINCARGGLIDEAALLAALESGQVAGAGIDVFETEPPSDLSLVKHPNVVSTPHLGASTREAQVRVGTEIARKIVDYLQTGVILDAVNFPSINREEFTRLGPVMDLAERLGGFASQIAASGVKRVDVQMLGDYGDYALKPVVMAAVKGLLEPYCEGVVSHVNALQRAEERGVRIDQGRSSERTPYAGLLRVTLDSDDGSRTVAGTLYGTGKPRLVEVDGIPIESRPGGHMLLIENRDVPGVVGHIGALLGESGINIAGIQLGRIDGTERAISIVNVDSAVGGETLEAIRGLDAITDVRVASIPD